MAGSKWAKSQDGLLWFKSAIKTIESNWARRSQLGPGSSWARNIFSRSQIGPRSQYGSEYIHRDKYGTYYFIENGLGPTV